jgi:nucleolar GTP-binding protein
MGFEDLPPIETVDTYLEAAMGKAKQASRKYNIPEHEKHKRKLVIAQLKISLVSDTICSKLQTIIDAYPNFDNLSTFYEELLHATINYDDLKQALGSVNWCKNQIKKVTGVTLRSRSTDEGAYYGRVKSLLKQINPQLKVIHNARKVLRTYPSIKDNMLTVCIAGFPNVGKSTLLSKLTPAKPEINSYAFTTKKLNQGYQTYNGIKVQFIDTPGTLNRDKMNAVELQAHFALRYVADIVICIFDLSSTAYSLDDQLALYKNMDQYDKKVHIYFSKQDIIETKKITDFIAEHKLDLVLADEEEMHALIKKATRNK